MIEQNQPQPGQIDKNNTDSIIERFRPDMVRFVRYKMNVRDDIVEDIVQNTCINIWKESDFFKKALDRDDIYNLDRYLILICFKFCENAIRAYYATQYSPGNKNTILVPFETWQEIENVVASESSADSLAIERFQREFLDSLVTSSKISKEEYQIMWLYIVECMPQSEIAAAYGVNTPVICYRIKQTLKKLNAAAKEASKNYNIDIEFGKTKSYGQYGYAKSKITKIYKGLLTSRHGYPGSYRRGCRCEICVEFNKNYRLKYKNKPK